MKCLACSSKQIYPYKKVQGVSIFKCKVCHLASVDPSTPRGHTSHIYSFADYQKREKQFIKRYINTIQVMDLYSPGKKILEVGSGFGLLSSMLHKAGYTVDTLEPVVTPRYLDGLPVKIHKEWLKEFADKTKDIYDAIILYDVIEHVDNPQDTILLFEKLLKRNGIVFIQTPNYQSLMAKIVKNWSWWMVEDHRFFFTRMSLQLLFQKKEWKELYYSTHEEWTDLKKNLDGNFTQIKNIYTRRVIKGLFFCYFVPFYFFFKRILWACNGGGLITTIYQKK